MTYYVTKILRQFLDTLHVEVNQYDCTEGIYASVLLHSWRLFRFVFGKVQKRFREQDVDSFGDDVDNFEL